MWRTQSLIAQFDISWGLLKEISTVLGISSCELESKDNLRLDLPEDVR
jgi:hypothetical protein